jgi:hypothetical protein
MEAGRIAWDDMIADRVHPNTDGHAFAARIVTTFLDTVRESLPPDDSLPAIAPLPKPLITDRYQFVRLYRFDEVQPAGNAGWTRGDFCGNAAWIASTPGSRIVFDVEGGDIHVMVARGSRFGNLSIRIDDGEPVMVENDKTSPHPQVLGQVPAGEGLPPGKHTVAITVEPKTPAVATTKCCIFGIGVTMPAGTGVSSQRGRKHP